MTADITTGVGTVLITGANGSLGLAFCENLLKSYPTVPALLTVRDASDRDTNTNRLRQLLLRKSKSSNNNNKVSIEQLDLASFSSVRSYATSVKDRIHSGNLPPLSAIVLNAFTWSLVKSFTKTEEDGIESQIQVNHLSQLLLVLLLADVLDKEGGARVVVLGSTSHDPTIPNPMRDDKFLPGLGGPDNLRLLFDPEPDKPGTEAGRGFQRYANSKLAAIMCMHKLNRILKENPSFSKVTALAMDPGGLPQSRCFKQVPRPMRMLMGGISFMLPIVKAVLPPDVRSTQQAGKMLVEISLDKTVSGAKEIIGGYYAGHEKVEGSKESNDEEKQDLIWKASVEKIGLEREDMVLQGVFS